VCSRISSLELGNRTEDVKKQYAAKRGRIDALGQRHPAEAALFKIVGRRDQFLQRSRQAVEFADDQRVTLPQHVVEHARELWSISARAGCALDVDLLAACAT
jgi:hypothetical protein